MATRFSGRARRNLARRHGGHGEGRARRGEDEAPAEPNVFDGMTTCSRTRLHCPPGLDLPRYNRCMTIETPTVVLFDIDGTLINTGGAGRAALEQALLNEFGIETPEQVPVMGRTDRGITGSLFEAHQIEDSEENWIRFRDAYLAAVPHTLPTKQGLVLPHVPEVLDHLSQQSNVELGLLTGNLDDGARIKLSYYGIYHHFEGGCGGYGDVSTNRDDVARSALDCVQQRFPSVEPEHIWVVGDTPLDIACSRAIGAKCVALTTGTFSAEELAPHQPDLLLDSLGDEAFLQAILS